jgi:hypothetical protein
LPIVTAGRALTVSEIWPVPVRLPLSVAEAVMVCAPGDDEIMGACCGDSGVPGRLSVPRLALAQKRDHPGKQGQAIAAG